MIMIVDSKMYFENHCEDESETASLKIIVGLKNTCCIGKETQHDEGHADQLSV